MDARLAGPEKERQRWRRRIRGQRLQGGARHDGRQRQAQGIGQVLRQGFVDIAQHGDDALADHHRLHLAQFKAERVHNVLLFDRRLADPEQTRLAIMLGEFFGLAAHIVSFGGGGKTVETLRARLERAAARQRIGFVRDPATVDGLAVDAVALVVVQGRQRGVDGDFMEVGAAQARDLRVHIRVDAALQQRVVGKIDAGYDVRRAKGHLLRLGEKIVGIAVQDHLADGDQRHQFFGNQLGGIEHVERKRFGLRFREHLEGQLVFGILAALDGFPQVAPVKIGIGAADLDGFVPHEGMRAGHRRPVEFAEHGLALGIDQTEGMHAEALHHPITARDGAVGHGPHQHVRDFRRQRSEIPEGVVRAGRLRHAIVRLGLDGVHQVRELHRILDEEDGDVIADQIPVALVRIKLHGKAAHVARRVGRTALAGHRGKAHEDGRALARLGEQRRARQLALLLVAFEVAMGGRTARMHDALGDALMVEMRELFTQNKIFHQGGTAQARLQRILVVAHGHALVGRQHAAAVVAAGAIEGSVTRVLAQRGLASARLRRSYRFARGAGRGQRFAGCHMHTLERRARRLAVLAVLLGIDGHGGSQLLAGGRLLQQRAGHVIVRAQAVRRIAVGWAGHAAQDGTRTVRGRRFLGGSHYISCE